MGGGAVCALLGCQVVLGAVVTYDWTGGGNDFTWPSSPNWTFTCPSGQVCSTNFPDDSNDDATIRFTDGTQSIEVPSYTIRRFRIYNTESATLNLTLQSDNTSTGDTLETTGGVILHASNGAMDVELDELLEVNTLG